MFPDQPNSVETPANIKEFHGALFGCHHITQVNLMAFDADNEEDA